MKQTFAMRTFNYQFFQVEPHFRPLKTGVSFQKLACAD